MLEDGKQGKINMFIALKLDRVTRSVKDWESLIEFTEKYNIDLALVNDKIDTTTANGKMVSRIMMSVSQNEIERTSERTKILMDIANQEGALVVGTGDVSDNTIEQLVDNNWNILSDVDKLPNGQYRMKYIVDGKEEYVYADIIIGG